MAVRRRRQMILVNCMFAVGEILQRRHLKMLRRLVTWKPSVGWCSYCRMIEGSLIFIRMTPELCINGINLESFRNCAGAILLLLGVFSGDLFPGYTDVCRVFNKPGYKILVRPGWEIVISMPSVSSRGQVMKGASKPLIVNYLVTAT